MRLDGRVDAMLELILRLQERLGRAAVTVVGSQVDDQQRDVVIGGASVLLQALIDDLFADLGECVTDFAEVQNTLDDVLIRVGLVQTIA